jgi:hypothetical protein
MRGVDKKSWILISIVSGYISSGFAWGFYGHSKINELAVYTLPKPLFGFYKANVQFMAFHAADADKRRYSDTAEACRHFMDGDHYERAAPFDTVPHYYSLAIEKYGKDSVLKHGIVPWHVMHMYFRLIEAFKAKDKERILRISADLGHYVGDCHVPLHSTSNYNGQKTGQKGIHALWESRITEMYYDSYDMLTGLSQYLEQPNKHVWEAYNRSFTLVDSVLKLEREVTRRFSLDDKYSWEERGAVIVRIYSDKFCRAYHLALNDMVEERLKASLVMLGSLIYTAWVQAGQPDLDNMPLDDVPINLPEKGTMIGRGEDET